MVDMRLGGVDSTAERPARAPPRRSRQDRLAYGGIIGSGLVCFVLLAWGHLGLGALLFPPKATAAQVIRAGDFTVALRVDSPRLTAGGPNDVALTIHDAQGRPLDGASVLVQPEMVGMQMDVPSVAATSRGSGVYVAHPKFGMAGDWRLVVTVAPRGGPPQRAAFTAGVRWS